MKNALKIIEELQNSEISKVDYRSFGYHFRIRSLSRYVQNIAEVLSNSGMQLNLITGKEEETFRVVYIFSSLYEETKILLETFFDNFKIPSLSYLFPNAEFYENSINEQFGLIFEESLCEIERSSDLFFLNQSSFDLVCNEPFYFRVLTCGEYVKGIYPEKGYHSRFLEMQATLKPWNKFITQSSKLDSYSGIYSNYCFCKVIERALSIDVPQRAKILRIISAELYRINYNLKTLSFLLEYTGLDALYSYVEILVENIKDLIDAFCKRPLIEYNQVGGVLDDVDNGFIKLYDEKTSNLLKDLDDLKKNSFIKMNLDNFCCIKKNDAIRYGITGVHLRGAGVPCDIRKRDNYGLYNLFKFKVSGRDTGNELNRFYIRIEDIFTSHSIIKKALSILDKGPFCVGIKNSSIPEGEYFYSVESPRGRLSYYIKGNGTEAPESLMIETPSIPMYCYLKTANGIKLDDLPLYIYSLGFSMAEVDK